MDNKYHEKLIVSSSPHMVTKTDTSKIMGTVLIALLPALQSVFISSDSA